jgi:hypothetical protein
MTKWIALPAAFVAAAALTLNVEAAPKTNAKANSPKQTNSPKTKPTTTKTTKGPSTKSTGAGATKTKGPKAASTTTAKGNGASTKKTASSSTTTATTTTTTTDWQPTNDVAEKLMTKPKHLEKLRALIGDDIDLNLATDGFKNFGQLNAAVNVSQNLDIEFSDLKAAMTGLTIEGEETNEPKLSLGQAIKKYRNDVDAEAEAATATAQAAQDGGQ